MGLLDPLHIARLGLRPLDRRGLDTDGAGHGVRIGKISGGHELGIHPLSAGAGLDHGPVTEDILLSVGNAFRRRRKEERLVGDPELIPIYLFQFVQPPGRQKAPGSVDALKVDQIRRPGQWTSPFHGLSVGYDGSSDATD